MDFARTIFAGLIYRELKDKNLVENVRKCHGYMKTRVRSNIFKNEYSVLYSVLSARKDIYIVSEESLLLTLERNKARFENSNMVNLDDYKQLVGEEGEDNLSTVEVFINSCLEVYNDIVDEVVSFETFKDAVKGYMDAFKTEYAMREIEVATNIMIDGLKRGNKLLHGYEDTKQYLYKSFMKLDNLTIASESDQRGIFKLDEEYFKESTSGDDNLNKLKFITDFGIKPLDDAIGGIHAGEMVSILAPAKSCKTRFSAFLAHRAVTEHKARVAVWVLEGNHRTWTPLLRARHFDYYYNKEDMIYDDIDSEHIKKGMYASEEYRQLEYASYYDLISNPNYGSIQYIDRPCVVDTFCDELEMAFETDPFDLLIIDYLMLVEYTRITQTQALEQSYQKLLRLQKRLGFATILPTQFKSTVVDSLHQGKSVDLRTAGGGSYETIKTPDINIGLYATDEELQLGRLQVLHIPSRVGKYFSPFYMVGNIGVCSFFAEEPQDM